MSASAFDEQAEKAIPAEFHMISGSHDSQTSADVWDVGSFQLPDPAGKAGGACTSALLQVLYRDHRVPTEQLSWVDALRRMRHVLLEMGYDQVPQLSSSRMVNVEKPLYIVPPNSGGTRRAVLIGINYVGQQGQLSGCHNDARNVHEYLTRVHGFEDSNIIVLMDDGINNPPTRNNILSAYRGLVQQSRAGDVVFCHYSGHGGRVVDTSGDESDGFDETLIPVDFQSAGHILDDELYRVLVRPMPAGVVVTCLMDCCHSGTVLDLPYRFEADKDEKAPRMYRDDNFDFSFILGMALMAGAAAGIGTQSSDQAGGTDAVHDTVVAASSMAGGGGGDRTGEAANDCCSCDICSEIMTSCCDCFAGWFE